MNIYEFISGARMHIALLSDTKIKINNNFFIILLSKKIEKLLVNFNKKIFLTFELLEFNSLLYHRLKKIGKLQSKEANIYNLSGVLLRSLGEKVDLRKKTQYDFYNKLNFSVPIRINGDSFDRFFIRVEELLQSIKIIRKSIKSIIYVSFFNKKIHNNNLRNLKLINLDMELIINKFKYEISNYFSTKLSTNFNKFNISIEAPKGESSIYISYLDKVSNNNIIRIFIKSPGFSHLQYLNLISYKYYIADLIVFIGTLDLVFGEIDR